MGRHFFPLTVVSCLFKKKKKIQVWHDQTVKSFVVVTVAEPLDRRWIFKRVIMLCKLKPGVQFWPYMNTDKCAKRAGGLPQVSLTSVEVLSLSRYLPTYTWLKILAPIWSNGVVSDRRLLWLIVEEASLLDTHFCFKPSVQRKYWQWIQSLRRTTIVCLKTWLFIFIC